MSKNLGYLFSKRYYMKHNTYIYDIEVFKKIMNCDDKEIPSIDERIFDTTSFELSDYKNYLEIENSQITFTLTTTYPGLLIGSGCMHEAGFANEFKIGFYFDYTTGIPIIPGSSIKGMLRSVFPQKDKEGNYDDINKEKLKYIKTIIKVKDDKDVEALKLNIFEGVDSNGNRISPYKRDIFFEAFPTKSSNSSNKFLADDYITHHENPLKNPNPVKFLKILSGIDFEFQFKLFDYNERISAKVKNDLFKQIILDMGIGAKTNVGYGQFIQV